MTLRWYNGTLVEVILGNDNSLCLYVCGSFEPNEFAFLHRVLRPGMVFVDVGANDGYYTLFAARRIGASGRAIAVEPSTRERVNLKRNIMRNGLGNVTVIPAALGASCGTVDLQLAQGVHSGHNTLGRFANDGVQAESVERVDMRTLDTLAAELGLDRIDFMKIDVEGAEAAVIVGGRRVLETMRPLILLEISDKALRAQGSGAQALIETLRRDLGYEIGVFSTATGRIELLEDGGGLSSNVVAMPRDRVAEIAGR
jgi:FkbM family methyltransferase